MTGARPNEDTAPCVGCGLCCNGTLYVRAKVTPGEELRLLEHGLQLTTHEGKTHFRLPCRYESCGRCTIYADRFDICRSFRCALLRSYQAGDINVDDARAKVTRALELLEEVKSDDPAAGLFVERHHIRGKLATELADLSPAERGPIAERLLRIIALDSYLERWFRNKKDQGTAEPDTNGSNS